MVQAVVMPKLGQTVDESTLVKWRKKVSDPVKKGDILFEIETDKAVLEVESFYEGTLLKIVVKEGETVPVTTVVGFVGNPGEPIPDVPKVAPAAPAAKAAPAPAAASAARMMAAPAATAFAPAVPAIPAAAAAEAPKAAQPASPRARALAKNSAINLDRVSGTGPGGRVVEKDVLTHMEKSGYAALRISPAAKQLAVKERVDILAVRGTGDDGRILVEDVERAVQERPKAMSKMRRIIAQRLTHSFTTTPHFFVTVSADMTDLLALRKELKAQGRPFSVTDFILESVVLALQEFPLVNSVTDGLAVRWNSHVHLGMAVSLDDGLVVPVIRMADRLSLAELHEAAAGLAARAREGKLLPAEMSGSTFTVSNMGMLNVENFTAIINPGESAILAVSSVIPTPAIVDEKLAVRSIMKLTLSSDHRIIDGATAARFANAIRHKLEDLELWKSLI